METWAQMAAKAVADGYLPGNRWEKKLRVYVLREMPEMVEELQATNDLDNYLRARTHSAFQEMEAMKSQGVTATESQSQAFRSMFPIPQSEAGNPDQ